MVRLFFIFYFLLFFTNIQAQTWENITNNPATFTTGNTVIGGNFNTSTYPYTQLSVTTNTNLYGLYISNTNSTSTKAGLYLHTIPSTSGDSYGIQSYVPFSNMTNTNNRKFGIYSLVEGSYSDSPTNGVRYGLYSKCIGKSNFAGYLHGDVGIKAGDLEFDSGDMLNNRFTIHLGWTNSDYSFNITPLDEDNTTYLFSRSFRLLRSGTLEKRIDNINSKAITVFNTNNNDEVFQVMGSGKVYASEIEVKPFGEFPDYVFADSYKLMPLDTLQLFVKENKHLPNVPSAKDIEEKNGIELGKMNNILLEKIEELHLYIFQLNEKVDAQSLIIENLQKQIKNEDN